MMAALDLWQRQQAETQREAREQGREACKKKNKGRAGRQKARHLSYYFKINVQH